MNNEHNGLHIFGPTLRIVQTKFMDAVKSKCNSYDQHISVYGYDCSRITMNEDINQLSL